MRCLFLSANRLALCGVVLACVGSTGCKSGWKMPGASYLSFNKKVSEETLAGSGPTMTAPVSPSTTQQPNLLAGNAKATKPTAASPSPLGNASGNPALNNTSASPYMTASATMPGQPSAVAGGVGAAASANGYATGPYSTYAQQQAGNTFAAAGSSYNNAASSAYNAAANGYNTAATGAYNAAATGYNTAATGAYNAAANGYNTAATGAYNAAATGYNTAATGAYNAAAPAAAAYGQVMQAANPQAGSFAPPSAASPATASIASATASPSWGTAAAKPAATAGYPTTPAAAGGYAQAGGSAQPGGYSAMPTATTPVSQGSMSAYNPVGGQSGYAATPNGTAATPVSYGGSSAVQASTASYRPGSTQRATGYDFSNPTGAAVSGGVPTSTASGMSNPGYQLPPSGSLQR